MTSPLGLFAPVYGPGSAARFAVLGPSRRVEAPNLIDDVDTIADLERLQPLHEARILDLHHRQIAVVADRFDLRHEGICDVMLLHQHPARVAARPRIPRNCSASIASR